MDLGCSKSELLEMIHRTVDENVGCLASGTADEENMSDSEDIHIRLMVSRGLKDTPHQNPRSTIGVSLIPRPFHDVLTSRSCP
jgi:branched-chain amino acid aminotransferase